ncbi:error-prone DNA polymerase [Microbulbifer halophilus]|uniref:Error-prone DNA polymerase n=1 Tax=Microbulbifer halophilus TaxID=453963 RepID=A0ABW5E7A5_9GAMM|nr:error-prone DNA polymerase [Microbulbifer halophilus]MCW8125644.1 error-prone DNA polymerase [Microbulbifer halophilus]
MQYYAELFCQSNFSFLQGASHPQELVQTAHQLGYRALAITDECSLSGVVRAYRELQNLKAAGSQLKLICGSLFQTEEGEKVVLLAPDQAAYSEICQLISRSRLREEKGHYRTHLRDLLDLCHKSIAIWLPGREPLAMLQPLKEHFGKRLYIAFSNHLLPQQNRRNHALIEFARSEQLPLVATSAALMHCRSRKPLQDVLNANYHHCTLDQLGYRIEQNAERYLRSPGDIQSLYPADALENTLAIADRCHFSLGELRYQYPSEVLPKNKTVSAHLRELVETGAKIRWPEGPSERIARQIDSELEIIAELEYEHYFLTIHDIVQYARSQHILYQGRGSAANSVVCYCLLITEVDPEKVQLLFERFISRERNEPPDIDVDFEHERREEIIQYIYRKYGRDRAGLAATKISYRFKSALRDIGKALGIGAATIEQLIAERAWWDKMEDFPQQMQKVGLDPHSTIGRALPQLLQQIHGFPRHLSQHVGGFVITEQPLYHLVPIENAAMEDRTIVQWDKEDIEDLKLMKVDVLALGMLTALRKSLNAIALYGSRLELQDIPREDPDVYRMICRADTVGVFQIESRAQMSMLPRLRPESFYELVIEVAIVRPGPIQGDMVHPYLRRKHGEEAVTYPHEKLKPVLERTKGVPIFQEQVIQLSMVAAGFSGGEADELRRAMASWGKNGDLYKFRDRLIRGMQANGYSTDFAEQLFNQMKGFGAYGFPESHSASFALLAYFSAWVKHHHPAAFYCGLLNSQPMGFYAPAQLVYDAQRHNVKVLPIDILNSTWHHNLELPPPSPSGRGAGGEGLEQSHLECHSPESPTPNTTTVGWAKRSVPINTPDGPHQQPTNQNQPPLRLGMRLIKSLDETSATTITTLRESHTFTSLTQFRTLTRLPKDQITALASADTFKSLTENRYLDTWRSLNPEAEDTTVTEHTPGNSTEDNSYSDYTSTGLTLREHPIALLRRRDRFRKHNTAQQLPHFHNGQWATIAGLVTCRQRPGSASGVIFLTLEDETGVVNVVLWEQVQQRYRAEIKRGNILEIGGTVQVSTDKGYSVVHLVGQKIRCLAWQGIQAVRSFH